ncbi:hypothetical protein I6A60_35880 [Frankia sp. AgB1.9]|uniref:hypothetical protein n=1 Tax=unclassified Frankia TaxID=2632575 RepID=UPI00193165DB|nr:MULTISPECIES: hypothetical protein [unclassified Frankia]MBL7488945.1 hypothetical protein [Frankia sp. AgW1.1]MBL7553194.1 hypothetical protein [Frankia sp. AgB1.9]MBL7625318.1 hypothetical protein [Frankia sp. AgB1.8]
MTGHRPRTPRLLRLACAHHRHRDPPDGRAESKRAWSPGRHCADCRVVWADGDGPAAAAHHGPPPHHPAEPPV